MDRAENSTSDPFIRVHEVSKRFGGVQALDKATIEFRGGEIHCLAGENGCGKSTLMKVISGVYRPDAGRVEIAGTSYDRLTPREAYKAGIEVIYQDFSLMPNLSVAENIALPGYVSGRSPFVDRRSMRSTARAAMDQLGIDLPMDAAVGDLTVAERQLCAVARAMAHQATFIAMDEPTTALTWREVEALFAAVRTLRDRGVAIVFVSHKMQEVFSLADRVTVMRSGAVVTSGTPAEFTHESLASAMTGRTSGVPEVSPPTWQDKVPALELSGLGAQALFADIDLTVGQGEIVGLSGLLGSGRTEIAEAVAGVRPADTGTIKVRGEEVAIRSVRDAMDAGIGYVPEDRLTQGLFLDQPIGDNLIAAHSRRFATRGGFLKRRRMASAEADMVRDLRIKIGGLELPVRSLSGGNAQRVLIGKWLVGEPKVLILNGPTVGVDVGSKFDILSMLHLQSLRGMGVLVISDDVPELVSTCHRVLVVRGGRIVSELVGDQVREETIVKAVSA